jgi:hypothetical protein
MDDTKISWKYVLPILPHRCCITDKILWGRKHYKVYIEYYSKYTSAMCIVRKWIEDTEGTQLILSGDMRTRIMEKEWSYY